MKIYVIFDHAEKGFVYDTKTGTFENKYLDMQILEFNKKEKAEKYATNLLENGNYIDKPSTILEVIEKIN